MQRTFPVKEYDKFVWLRRRGGESWLLLTAIISWVKVLGHALT
ncbi:MAG: hypothetical protein Q7T85_05920 [Nitrosomonas sp.]|nr:hypothetical protein [Nitrosomonas sp.]